MSNEWEDGTEEFPAEVEGETGIKKLRAAYDRKVKAEKELKDKLDLLEARDRERSLGDVLRSKGLNTKLAKFYPAGAETSEEKVNEWLTENADVFGQTTNSQQPPAPQIPQELRDAYEQFQQPMGSPANQDAVSAIKNFQINSEEDYQKFLAFMRQNPGSVQN
jgi:hypothetical protein